MKGNGYSGYSLSIYHFNLQYNAGNEESYHVLITKSFVPFLDFYMAHPEFKASLEFQGHAIAFMARYYPDELEKLVTLVMERNQVELISVHYSDQVYLAYPKRDLQESIRINDKTLSRYGLKRGPAWFAQENFFGPGVVDLMKKNGFKVALLNRHYLRHYQGDIDPAPYWERDGIYFLSSYSFNRKSDSGSGVNSKYEGAPQLYFDYWGDGELAFTRGNNYFPFHGPSEKKRLKRLALYTKRHADGIMTAHCMDYVNALADLGITPQPLPPVLDGSWNYPSYGGVYLWMGRYRLWWEKDGYVRTHTFVTRAMLLAAETLMANLESIPPQMNRNMEMAWRHLLLAEVSDSTGQTPVITEVKYSFMESNLARKAARDVIKHARSLLGHEDDVKLWIDTRTGDINVASGELMSKIEHDRKGHPTTLASMERDLGPLGIHTFNMRGGSFSIHQRVDTSDFPGDYTEYYLQLDFRGRPTTIVSRVASFFRQNTNFKFHEKFDKIYSNYVGFTMPMREQKLVFCPALMEEQPVDHEFGDFQFQRTIGKTFLPLPNGLIGIGEDLYLVKHNLHGNTHIAATVDIEQSKVGFLQDCPPGTLKSSWRFSLLKASLKDAVMRANQLNVHPRILV